jgi:hypothetical protein
MSHATCHVRLVSTVNDCRKNPLEEQALVAGTKQNLSNLVFFYIYAANHANVNED